MRQFLEILRRDHGPSVPPPWLCHCSVYVWTVKQFVPGPTTRDFNETKMDLQVTDVINTTREYKERNDEKLQGFGLGFELGLGLD